MATIKVTADNIDTLTRSEGIVILDFWAPWCGPCRMFGPVFEAASEAHPDLTFGKVNTEEEQVLAGSLGIRSIPTLMVLRDGILVYRQPGALPADVFEDLIAQARALNMEEVRAEVAKSQAAATA